MKAAVVKGKRLLAYEEVPTPSIRPGAVLLKMRYCCICGSDLEYVDDKMQGNPVTPGTILGHEFLAEVADVGEGVEGWSIGDRAVPGLRPPCGQCYWCRRMLHHMCLGGPTIPGRGNAFGAVPGAMAEYFVRPAASLLKVPDGVSDEEAGVSQPLTVGTWMVHCSELTMGESAAVIGAGHIGLATLACVRVVGAAPIIVTDMIEPRLDAGLEMGADVALNPERDDVVARARELTDAGVDVVFICVREGDVMQQAFDMVRMGGRIIICGMPSPEPLSPARWMSKQVRIEGSRNVGAKMDTTLRLLQYKRVNLEPLVSAIMPLADAQGAFESLYSCDNIAVLLRPKQTFNTQP